MALSSRSIALLFVGQLFIPLVYGGQDLLTKKKALEVSMFPSRVVAGPDSRIPPEILRDNLVYIAHERGTSMNQFRLCNTTRASIFYSGYGPSGPWYRIQTKKGNDWEELKVGWFCGTGLTRNEIPPGASARFGVTDKAIHGAFRVGISFSTSKEQVNHPTDTVWSDAVWAP